MKKQLQTSTFLLLLHLSLVAQTPYFPGKVWQQKAPAAFRMNAKKLDSAVRFAQRHETATEVDLRLANLKDYQREPGYKIAGPMKSRGGPAGMIIKNGYVVAQWGDTKRVDMTFSVTKSFLSAVAGLAVDAGLITQATDSVSHYVWSGQFDGPHNGQITWQHLLQQTSDWSGCQFDICDWADRPPKDGTPDDWQRRKLEKPGTVFEYNDVRVNLLAYSLLQVWRKPLPVVLKEKIMDPIGASTTWRWFGYEQSYTTVDGQQLQSVSGGGHHGGGLFISTEDMARFGLLYLRNGLWNQQRLLSSQWIQASQQPSAANTNYGYLWWLNYNNEWPAINPRVYYAAGFGGNFIVIDQKNDLLMVLRWLEPQQIGTFVQLVAEALD